MPKFYEIGLIIGGGYFALVLFSIIGFFGGKILPMGFAFVTIPFFIELIKSIYFIKISIENKKIHFLCFSIIIFLIAVFAGVKFDNYETNNTKKNLLDMVNAIEEYKQDNEIKELTEHDLININVPKNVRVNIINNGYVVKYRDAVYISETETISFRPRP